jgi:hypothetical protein
MEPQQTKHCERRCGSGKVKIGSFGITKVRQSLVAFRERGQMRLNSSVNRTPKGFAFGFPPLRYGAGYVGRYAASCEGCAYALQFKVCCEGCDVKPSLSSMNMGCALPAHKRNSLRVNAAISPCPSGKRGLQEVADMFGFSQTAQRPRLPVVGSRHGVGVRPAAATGRSVLLTRLRDGAGGRGWSGRGAASWLASALAFCITCRSCGLPSASAYLQR